MTQIEDIENAVKRLPTKDLKRFRQWFATFEAEVWDAQIEADAVSGKLDALASDAMNEYEKGNTKEL